MEHISKRAVLALLLAVALAGLTLGCSSHSDDSAKSTPENPAPAANGVNPAAAGATMKPTTRKPPP